MVWAQQLARPDPGLSGVLTQKAAAGSTGSVPVSNGSVPGKTVTLCREAERRLWNEGKDCYCEAELLDRVRAVTSTGTAVCCVCVYFKHLPAVAAQVQPAANQISGIVMSHQDFPYLQIIYFLVPSAIPPDLSFWVFADETWSCRVRILIRVQILVLIRILIRSRILILILILFLFRILSCRTSGVMWRRSSSPTMDPVWALGLLAGRRAEWSSEL